MRLQLNLTAKHTIRQVLMINKDNGWETYVQQPQKSLNRERNSPTRKRQAGRHTKSVSTQKETTNCFVCNFPFVLQKPKPVRTLKIMVSSYSYHSLLSTAMLYPDMSQVANRTPMAPPHLDLPHISQMTFLLT